MGKIIHKPCEFCYMNEVRVIPNQAVERHDEPDTYDYNHNVKIIYSLQDDNHMQFPGGEKIDIMTISTTPEKISLNDAMDMYMEPANWQSVFDRMRELKMEFAGYNL